MKKNILFLALVVALSSSYANVKLPVVFGDSMVLQRDQPVMVWGWANAGEKVTVKFHAQNKSTTADASGKWKLQLDPEKAGGPYTLTVAGANTITLKDILVGEVWVCSGQSNMEMAVKHCDSAELEIKSASFPQIRHLAVQKDMSGTPKDDLAFNARWQAATPGNVADFTAVGYFFAREIHRRLGVPVGLIHSSWGGTVVETWTSKEGFGSDDYFNAIASLPSLDIDSAVNAKKAVFASMVQKLQGRLPQASAVAAWKNETYNDNSWPKMQLPAAWETQQLKNFDGAVWFRRSVNIPAADAGKPAMLGLGFLDDSDSTYVNGKLVGTARNQAQTKRLYNIPAGVLKAGINNIAIKVEDYWGSGGVTGEKNDLYLQVQNGGKQALAGDWNFQVESVAENSVAVSPNNYPSLLFNAMINPIIPFTMRGVLWYQGESNADRAYEYRRSFPLMINDWRRHWNQGDFPFYFVQLSSFNWANGNDSNTGSRWGELREAQSMTLSLPNTGMAVTTDIGNRTDIHPHNKQDVGKRLAAVALHNTYQLPVVYAGPTYETMEVEGNKVTILFSQTHTGLMTKEDKYGYIKGFEIAGADKKFYFARAVMEGHRVVVSADSVKQPVAVRYAWADDAGEANLYNKEGFPAVPFRTDQWKGTTEEKKYQPSK